MRSINRKNLRMWPVLLLSIAWGVVACNAPGADEDSAAPESLASPTPALSPAGTPTSPPATETPTAVPETAVSLGETFILAGGQEVALDEGGLSLHFAEVLEDSRCPTDVDCFWTGQARIRITATQPGQEPIQLEFNTNPAPGETVDQLMAGEYTVQLLQLDPYPKSPDTPIAFADYQAQLVVTR